MLRCDVADDGDDVAACESAKMPNALRSDASVLRDYEVIAAPLVKGEPVGNVWRAFL